MTLLPLGKQELLTTYSLSPQVDVGDLIAYVIEWQGINCEWSKIRYNRTLHDSWDRTDFTTTKLPFATETRASLTFYGGRMGES